MNSTGNNKEVFAVLLVKNRIWGYLFLPYKMIPSENKAYFKPVECLFPSPSRDTLSCLQPEQQELIRWCSKYSERELFQLFSREKSVQDFLHRLDQEKLEKHIRPYIEKYLFRCYEHIRETGLPVYRKKGAARNIHASDKLLIHSKTPEPEFRFTRSEEGTEYKLALKLEEKELSLPENESEILVQEPCLLRLREHLYHIPSVEGNKIKPFLSKETIRIPPAAEKKYYRTFVLQAINKYPVKAAGFRIVHTEPEKNPVLDLEYDLRQMPVALLSFRYGTHPVLPSFERKKFTRLQAEEPDFIFNSFTRDTDWEQDCEEKLLSLGFTSNDHIHFKPVEIREDPLLDLLRLVSIKKSSLDEMGFIIHQEKLQRRYSLQEIQLDLTRNTASDWFDIHATVQVGTFRFPFTRLRRHILENIREYKLPDGTYAVLPLEWFARYRTLFEFGTENNGHLQVHKQHFPVVQESIGREAAGKHRNLEKLNLPGKIPVSKLPKGLHAEMRAYQKEGLSWLCFLRENKLGGCLADDMGLGKTLQTLALLQQMKENAPGKKPPGTTEEEQMSLFPENNTHPVHLIIVPASLIHNWVNEVRKFTPALKTHCHAGNQRRKKTDIFKRYDLIITSYHTARQDIDLLETFHFSYIILDESQMIKNPSSQIFRTVTRLHSEYKLVLTGTPIENSLTDLWTQLHFVNRDLLGSLAFFKREFVIPVEKKRSSDREKQLQKIIRPFILRRTKNHVAGELPPVTERTVWCAMTEEQKSFYEKEKSTVRNSILKNIDQVGVEKSAIMVLQGLMKLRQISSHPILASGEYTGTSGKYSTLLQDIASAVSGGHKILLFSSFVRHLELFACHFKENGLKYSLLTGSTIKREEVVRSFQDDPGNKLFLISLKAGGVGLNLTAADYVFLLDPWWNPAAEMQALNRAHRIGQEKRIFVYRYISEQTIEEKIIRLQDKKSRLADTFIHTNNPLKDMHLKELIELID